MGKTIRNRYVQWTEENLVGAIDDVIQHKMSVGKAAKKWSMPKSTLFDHLYGKSKHAGKKKLLGRRPVLMESIEVLLVDYIKQFADNLFGLTPTDVKKLAYQVAQRNQIPHNFNHDTQSAGKKWLTKFLHRHPDLSILAPEKLSYARIKNFTQEVANTFYDVLHTICATHNITATTIFNMDETGFGTVVNKAQKVLAQKGTRHLSTAASGERGINTTVVACMSAAGQWVPPFVIFKGTRIGVDYSVGLTPGGMIAASDSGFINSELFIVWLEFFIKFVKCSPEKPVVLVLDGHTSHSKCIEALELAQAHGVIMVQLPAHCTHRMQPLDVAFFYPLGQAYATEVRLWQAKNPGVPFSTRHFCSVFSKAYEAKATIAIAKKSFESSGIWPVNRDVFNDTEFARLSGLDEMQQPNENNFALEIMPDTSPMDASLQPTTSATNCPETTEQAAGIVNDSKMQQRLGVWMFEDLSLPENHRRSSKPPDYAVEHAAGGTVEASVTPSRLAANCTITSKQANERGCSLETPHDPLVSDSIAALSDPSNGRPPELLPLKQSICMLTQRQAASTASIMNEKPFQPVSSITSDQVTRLIRDSKMRQNMDACMIFGNLSIPEKHRQSSQPPDFFIEHAAGGTVEASVTPSRLAANCTITSKQTNERGCSLETAHSSDTIASLSGPCNGLPPILLPLEKSISSMAQIQATTTVSNLDGKPILSVPLEEILPIPTIRKPQKSAAAPVINLTCPIYISGLKEKNRIKEEKAKEKEAVKEAKILAKKLRDDKKEFERKAREEKKLLQQLAKEEKKLEAMRKKEQRQAEKAEKENRKRAKKMEKTEVVITKKKK